MEGKTFDGLADEFGECLKAHDKQNFKLSTLNDVKRELDAIEDQRHHTKTIMDMRRIRSFLRGMEDFEVTLKAIGNHDMEQPMAYIWGSMRFLLKHTNPTDKAFDNVLDVYEQLGCRLPHFLQHGKLFQEVTDTQMCLLNIYDDVRRFHTLAYKLFSLRPKLWQRLHGPTWKDSRKTFEQIARSLDDHKAFIETCSRRVRGTETPSTDSGLFVLTPDNDGEESKEFARYRAEVKASWKRFEDDEAEKKGKQKKAVKTWIASSNKIEEMHKQFLKTRKCQSSGRWLFGSYGEVSDWMSMEDPPESAIWLHGSKGFGKTILASTIVQELTTLRDPKKKGSVIPRDSQICYFYCQEDDEEHRTYLGILKGILKQMVDSNDYILPLCDDRISAEGVENTTNVEVAQMLIETFIQHSTRQYIIIDGLNECEKGEIIKTADFFMSQVAKCDNDIKQAQLRVLFMSEFMSGDIQRHMPGDDASIHLKPTDNQKDIQNYVKERLPDFSKSGDSHGGFNLDESEKAQIEITVWRQSGEMFLYAHLAIEYLLQQQTKGDLLSKIKQHMLPDRLATMYERLLESVKFRLKSCQNGEAQWEKAKLLLGWLVCAKRPLQWHEMQAIISFDCDQKVIDFDNNMLRHNVEKYLGSLVHVLKGGHIRLLHSTARQYIINNKSINEMTVQCKLTSLCLNYLSLPCFEYGYDESHRQEKARLGWFSFQDYACSHWHIHIETFIRTCNGTLDETVQEEFANALQLFIEKHGTELSDHFHRELEWQDLDNFRGLPFYDNLLRIWNHIFTHQKDTFEVRNTIGIPQLDKSLCENRAILENYFVPDSRTVNEDTIKDYYGPNLFKCRRILCRFFHVGYNDKKARDNHDSRHDRPYPCPAQCNSAPIGFATKKDRDRHVRIYHPEESEQPSMFEAPSRGQAPARFDCPICQKTFTRKENLKGHERSHFGARPYACPKCAKAFARISDCRRHEKNKSCKTGV